MTEFIFIRHGETDFNRQQRFQGQVDVPLNASGHAQAARLAQRLAHETVDGFVCSDLLRTRETAAPLAAAWRMTPQLDKAFREQSFGVLEGLDVPTIKTRHADLWAQWLEHRADFRLPQGESLREFHARVLQAVRDLARRHEMRKLAIVTHDGVLDMLWRTAHGVPLDGLRGCEIPNTGINRVRWRDDALHITSWADAEHLSGLPAQAGTAAGER